MGLTQVLDDRNHALEHQLKNATVCQWLYQAVVKGVSSSTFIRSNCLANGITSCNLPIDRFEGSMQRETEAKIALVFLSNLTLEIRTTGYEHQNNIQEFVQRLEELCSEASESTRTDWFIDH